MSCSGPVRFEEAERARLTVLSWTAITCATIGWLCSSSPAAATLVAGIAVYLLTGDRYQWIYISVKTFSRDWAGLKVLLPVMYRIRLWERQGRTVAAVWEDTCKKYQDKKAFVMGDRYYTFKQGDEFANQVAWYFKRQGFKPGEVIALYMEAQPDYVLLWLGLAKLGVIISLVNSNLKGGQLLHCLRVASCKAVIFGDEMHGAVKEIQKDLQDTPLFQYNSPDRPNAPHLGDSVPLATELKEMPKEALKDKPVVKPKDTLMYIYTSGTTGLPKAAIITNIRYLFIPTGLHTASRLTDLDIIYVPIPLHHSAGGILGVGQAIVHGCTVAMRQKFSASNYWKDCAKYGCTVAQYIGEICRYLVAVPPGPADKAHKVRVIIGNGLRAQIWEQFVKRFNIERVVEFYGATEGNSNLINLDSKIGAVGFLSRLVAFVYPLVLVRCDELTGELLRDEKGLCIKCAPYEPGLLLGKIDARQAILNFAGYADKTASEKKIVRNVQSYGDYYFNTGDILVMDHFGYFYFRDRTGDTFRWRGENVSTAEVEGVISSLAGLHDTIVFGVAIPNIEGKAGMAAIADPEKKLDLSVLAKGLKNSLPAYSRPLFIRILPESQLTATFKLKKRELMEQGYDPQKHQDLMYFLDQKTGEYVRLTQQLYEDIINGVVRL